MKGKFGSVWHRLVNAQLCFSSVCVCVSPSVPSAQMAGLLCEEEGPGADNVKYCGYCKHHYNKMVRRCVKSTVKIVADENDCQSEVLSLKIKTTLTVLFLTPLEPADWLGFQPPGVLFDIFGSRRNSFHKLVHLLVRLTVLSVSFGSYSRRSCAPVRTHKAAPLLIPGGALALHRRTSITTTGRGRLEVPTVVSVTLNEFIISILQTKCWEERHIPPLVVILWPQRHKNCKLCNFFIF